MYITVSFFNSWDNGNSEIDFWCGIAFYIRVQIREGGTQNQPTPCFSGVLWLKRIEEAEEPSFYDSPEFQTPARNF